MMVFVCEDLKIRSTETVNSISEGKVGAGGNEPGWGMVSFHVSCLTNYERLKNNGGLKVSVAQKDCFETSPERQKHNCRHVKRGEG